MNTQSDFLATPILIKEMEIPSLFSTAIDGTLFFTDINSSEETELWKVNEADAAFIKNVGDGSIAPQLTNLNGSVLFIALDGETPENWGEISLWKSDGTPDGTIILKTFTRRDPGNPTVASLINVNGTLFFQAFDSNGAELWKSDGTPEGTMLLKDIHTGVGSSSSDPGNLTDVYGTLFFTARVSDDARHGLWKSDGTTEGTVSVKAPDSDSKFLDPRELTNVNGTLFLSTGRIGETNKLWKSDGTTEGTELVKDIDLGFVNNLTAVDDSLFFTTAPFFSADELWKSDGTPEGTVLVKDFNSDNSSARLSSFTNVDGTLFFTAIDATNGQEVWKSDGSPEGTTLVSDIIPGGGSSWPRELTNVNGTLFFSALSPTNGRELWMSDGTPEGTVLVSDINPGRGSSNPQDITYVDGNLFFIASPSAGVTELMKIDVSSIVRNVIDGDDQDNYLPGTSRDDQINGLDGSDLIIGEEGDDELNGGPGYDGLVGGSGDDLLDGGAEIDGLVGGPGADQFLLRAGDGNDIIFDYQDGTDQFLLDGLTFDQLGIRSAFFNSATIISIEDTGESLATLIGEFNSIGSEDFVTF